MISHSHNAHARLSPLVDFSIAFIFAYFSAGITNRLTPVLGWQKELTFNLFSTTPFLAGMALCSVPFILHTTGFYRKNNLQSIGSAFRQVICFAAYYFAAWAIYQSTRNNSLHFNHVVLVNAIGIPLCIFCRFLITRFWRLHTRRGRRGLRQVILAGSAEDIQRHWETLPTYWKNRFNVVGKILSEEYSEKAVQEIIESNNVSHLIVCGGLRRYKDNEQIIQQCELQGIDIYLMLNADIHPGKLTATANEVQSARMLILSSQPTQFWPRLIKDIMDRIVASFILLCTLPLWIITAIGIKISDPKGPIFYRQQRSGLYGKPFRMWKFRSMYADADKRLAEVKAQYGNEMSGPIFKLTNDPRIFRFGHIIRKLSIDELPQLLNIIAGDMSIVGPRPLPVYETAEFPSIAHRRRLSVKPGLTCYWQIEDRSDNGDFDNLIQKDLKYIDNWSLWLDIVLFFRTIPAVLFGKGAK